MPAQNSKSQAKDPRYLTVGEVARRAGVRVSTLHFYEQKGLIAAERSDGNQRRYTRDILRRLAIIRVARGLGVSLEEISTVLEPFPPTQKPTPGQVREMVAGWRRVIQQRINGLLELRDHLDTCIGCGCLSMGDCPLRNPSDELANQGDGPQLLTVGRPSSEASNRS